MKRHFVAGLLAAGCAIPGRAQGGFEGTPGSPPGRDGWERRFRNPPVEDRLGVYWFWSNATDEGAITRDLEEMSRVGIGRAILSMTQAHSATLEDRTGTVFLSPRFLEIFRFALDEAARLGIQITAIPSNGWYQGGPWVTPEMGPQMLVWSRIECSGPESNRVCLPVPDRHRTGRHARIARGAMEHLKPVAVMAFQKDAKGRLLGDSRVDLSSKISASGELDWAVPTGNWVIYRFAHVPNMAPMKQDSPGYGGLQIDHMSRAAMERHLQEVAVPMLKAAGPHVGKTLDRLHEDSMEIGFYDWTPLLPKQFKERRGYDLIPLLPLLAGDSFTDGPPTDRVEHDFEELLEDLLIDEHFGAFREFCHRHGLTLIAESGHTGSGIKLKGAPVDHVMDEFWTHFGLGMDSITLNRNAAFATQVYGQNRYTCEAFTSHQQWLETPAQLKALANEVFARGLNHLTIHGFSSSPKMTPPPGDVYFAGTHFNPGVTWWNGYARPLTAFFNRCQAMLTAGLPVVDILYVDGPALQEMIKTNEMLWESARRFWKFAGIPDELLAERASVDAAGRIEIPNGPSYPVLVVADTDIKLEAMRAVVRLVEQGATVWFQAIPDHTPSFSDGPGADAEIRDLVKTLGADRAPGMYQVGNGRILTGADRSGMKRIGPGVRARTFHDGMHAAAMDQLGILPAFSYETRNPNDRLYSFQRSADGVDVHFVANALRTHVQAECTFRVAGKQPERWDPVSGKVSDIQTFSVAGDRTVVPLEFAPHESFFVVFRKPASEPVEPEPDTAGQDVWVEGPWTIAFDPAREGLESFTVESDSLFQWERATDRRIADFSGTAVYRTTVEISGEQIKSAKQMMLDLGQPPELYKLTGMGAGKPYGMDPDFYDALCAEVLINGQSAGVLWCSPYRVDVSSLVRAGDNEVEIRVTNTWHNWRLANQFTAGTHPWEKKGLELPPAPAGLIGPVQVLTGATTSGSHPRASGGNPGVASVADPANRHDRRGDVDRFRGEAGGLRGAGEPGVSTTAPIFQTRTAFPLRIMPLGDSITVGFTDNPAWEHPFHFGYRSGLYRRMKEAGYDFVFVGSSKEPFTKPERFGDPTHDGTVRPTVDLREFNQNGHHGHAGFGITGIQRFAPHWINREKPDIILLLIGINGISAESPEQLDSLVHTIYDTSKEVALLVAQIPPSRRYNQNIVDYNTFIRETLAPKYAGKGYTIGTVDQYKHFLTDPQDPRSIDAARLSNGLNHPTNAMYDKMAASWFSAIESIVKSRRPAL